jgi:hypothetical protein
MHGNKRIKVEILLFFKTKIEHIRIRQNGIAGDIRVKKILQFLVRFT